MKADVRGPRQGVLFEIVIHSQGLGNSMQGSEPGWLVTGRTWQILQERLFRLSFCIKVRLITFVVHKTRGVAQLVSALRSGRRGRKFESSHPDKKE